jgi:hypothetical protein
MSVSPKQTESVAAKPVADKLAAMQAKVNTHYDSLPTAGRKASFSRLCKEQGFPIPQPVKSKAASEHAGVIAELRNMMAG